MKTVTIYTDGACSGNPGPGGWGAILEYNGQEKEISGGEANTTNNRMELTAVISALQILNQQSQLIIIPVAGDLIQGNVQSLFLILRYIHHNAVHFGNTNIL